MDSKGTQHGRPFLKCWMSILTIAVFHSTVLAQSDPANLKKYIDRLNAPILRVSADEKAYTVYFDAYQLIDSSDPRAYSALVPDSPFHPYVTGYRDAIEWAGEADQQEAIDLILERNRRGFNSTERQLFGLPYGVEQVTSDMAVFDFVASWSGNNREWFWSLSFEYLAPYSDLACLLRAEAFRRAEEGNTDGAVEALMSSVRMWRQLANCSTAYEMKYGMNMVRHMMPDVRNFMWVFRDKLKVEDYKRIAKEIERLDLTRMSLPTYEEIVGEQLIDRLYGTDNRAKPDEFALELARAATIDRPLRRFGMAESLQFSVAQQSAKRDQQAALKDAMADWQIRWRSPIHSSIGGKTDYEKLKYIPETKTRNSIMESALEDIPELFELRIPLLSEANGTATAAGIHGFVRAEGGRLVKGQDAIAVSMPAKLAQVQPSFVSSESSLIDHYAGADSKFFYTTVRNLDPRFAFEGFTVTTVTGSVKLREHWPLLYSVGPNHRETLAEKSIPHSLLPDRDDKNNIVYFPNIEMLMHEN